MSNPIGSGSSAPVNEPSAYLNHLESKTLATIEEELKIQSVAQEVFSKDEAAKMSI